jgi:hypothetical protein
MIADLLRQQADMLNAMATLCDKGDVLKSVLDRLDMEYPRIKALGAVEMARYWNVSEGTARERMHAVDFPSEKMGAEQGKNGRLVVSKIALALYEIGRA